MAQPAGIVVHLSDPEETVTYSDATSATVGTDGSLIVLRARASGFPEALDTIPRDRWQHWTPRIDTVATSTDHDPFPVDESARR